MRRFRLTLLCVLLVVAGCREHQPNLVETAESAAPTVIDTEWWDTAPQSEPADVVSEPEGVDVVEDGTGSTSPPDLTLATWNLRNFSRYGAGDYRIEAIAERIDTLAPDLLGLQELKPADAAGNNDAFEALMAQLPEYDGFHVEYPQNDTSVGLLYPPDRTQITGWSAIFPDDWYAFPRPPLRASAVVTKGGQSVEFTVIVLHLKAFQDGADRRREACLKLDAYIQARPDERFVVLGDFNDDPYDIGADNVFSETFLADAAPYDFVTHQLPPESVTSTGWHHRVDGVLHKGEFIDHIVFTANLRELFSVATPHIDGVTPNRYDEWNDGYSDHFPVWVATSNPPTP